MKAVPLIEWLFYFEKSLLKTDLEFKDYNLALIGMKIKNAFRVGKHFLL